MRLMDRNVVITGASSGIGQALAVTLARRGARLVLAARRKGRLQAIADALRREGGVAHAIACDVAVPDEISALIREACSRLGGIDVLINNAGVSAYGATERTTDEDFERLLAVNLWGPWHAMREVLPVMRGQGDGLIVNVASVAALHGPPYLGAYAATKAALGVLTQSLRAELATDGVRFMGVYPGYTRSEIYERETQLGGARRPRGRYASPDRVARAVVRGIEHGRHDVVLSPEGRGLRLLQRLLPRAVDPIMHMIAIRLRELPEVKHVQA